MHEGWTFAGMYTDEGISGTGTAHRSGFTQMVQDALAGRFSLMGRAYYCGRQGRRLV